MASRHSEGEGMVSTIPRFLACGWGSVDVRAGWLPARDPHRRLQFYSVELQECLQYLPRRICFLVELFVKANCWR